MSNAVRSRHTGLVVTDLDRSSQFYRSIFGLELVCRETAQGSYIEQLVGISDVCVEWVKLKTSDGYIVELLKYHSHPERVAVEELRRASRAGCSHIAFTVSNIEQLYSTLCEQGYVCKSEPLISPDGRVKVMYAHDPDGIIVECVEELRKRE